MKVLNKKVLPPHAVRTIEGLRDTGYEFNTAMADIIDNSIAASASRIKVVIGMDLIGDISIFIADNGTGMNEDGLDKAMTYGSPQRGNLKSLGKFGLGLKTASTAFCRKLSVTTRDNQLSKIRKACWDLDYIADTAGDWELLYLEPSDQELELLEDVSEGQAGTVVTWENVDRLLKEYQEPTGSYARKALEKAIVNLSKHVAMVYQRFLDKSYDGAPNVTIIINDNEITAWDPFCLNEPNTELVASDEKTAQFTDDSTATFNVNAYVLPRKEEFSSEENHKQANLSNDFQGFFIYRENRLIHYGNWMGMFSNEPHSNLLRVEFSFDYLMDEAFNIDIKKSRIQLNSDLFDWLKEQFLPAPRRAANDRYRRGQKSSVQKVSKGAHDSSNKGISIRQKEVTMSRVEITDKDKNEVQITNNKGKVSIKLPVLDPAKDGEVHVSPVESIEDGLLWEPALINTNHAVRINTNHPYYNKVYVPNLNSGVTILGMDALLWALSEAELGTVNKETEYHLKEIRYAVSRILRRLVEDLPDPELEDI